MRSCEVFFFSGLGFLVLGGFFLCAIALVAGTMAVAGGCMY